MPSIHKKRKMSSNGIELENFLITRGKLLWGVLITGAIVAGFFYSTQMKLAILEEKLNQICSNHLVHIQEDINQNQRNIDEIVNMIYEIKIELGIK